MNELLQEMQIVVLRGQCILPGSVESFDITLPAAIQSAQSAVKSGGQIFLAAQKSTKIENPQESDLYTIGVIAEIRQLINLPKGLIRVIVEGKSRAELVCFVESTTGLKAQVILFEHETASFSQEKEEAMLRSLKDLLDEYAQINPTVGELIRKQTGDVNDIDKFMDVVGNCLPVPYQEKQELLEAVDPEDRFEVLLSILGKETEITKIKNEIQQKVKERIDKNQREYILREQIKVIHEELGETDTESEVDQFTREVEELDADESVKERLKKEIGRYRSYSANMAESSVLREWIEVMLELPWNKKSEDSADLARAKQILDEDHYGLDEVKERVLEFLAVRHLTKGGASPIICLVGPPGTGKTSIAQSVAKALGKQYVRITLGGVRDEAEIRGHRRTYVGAMPGRIVAGLRNAGVKNPLMLLDEIDKMSSDYKGDTASAMLEVLDSEQNSHFNDHYVDMPVDLSEVLFIATANDRQTIPQPLLDRMEVIEVSSYTANEKEHIAREHLIEKQRKVNGLLPEQITFTDEAVRGIIESYTREAGVRNLERKIGQICRKGAREIYEGSAKHLTVDRGDLETYLGKERFRPDEKNEMDEIGIARGLAWTSFGGTTLQIEVNVMPGTGSFKLTGQIGDVMRESAEAGISYIRSVSREYEIDSSFFTEYDIHIHIPEGGVPKDGPSAGITMATAMISAITGRRIRADVAMTGEITLRGRVLPVGGLKEKLLAAKTAGIATVCVPDKNRSEIEEISEEITEGMEIVFVNTMEEVLSVALI